jgi:indole-3-acetaldehyde oxidase
MGSLGKDAAAAASVVLAVNGVRREAAGVHPSMTLLEFLRTQTPVRGPKLGCGEGTSWPLVVDLLSFPPVSVGSGGESLAEYTSGSRLLERTADESGSGGGGRCESLSC